jgi:tetratricopeptide (TPR) repeat protein
MLAAPVTALSASCRLALLAQLPVTMSGMCPMVTASFNGSETQLIADSGAFYSMISAPIAAQFKLRLSAAPYDLRVNGIGGGSFVSVATVHELGLANLKIPNFEFMVGGSEVGGGAAGVLGQNVLGWVDAEYDLAKGVIRLMRPHDCRKASLAYWASEQPYSVLDIQDLSAASFHTVGTAYLNGAKIRVLFDTGASTSILSLRAAARAGIKPDSADVVPAGESHGFGRGVLNTWIAPFASFKIGQEEIRNTHLRIGDIDLDDADMLIGADFFLSHHVYVANSQQKLYFTYNGGAVFNLATAKVLPAASHAADTTASTPADSAQPLDASAFARRGAAFAARRDYEHALADLTRACEMEPGEARYLHQRSLIYLQSGQRPLALKDIDQALQLRPDDPEALLLRANLRLADGKSADANTDLQAADHAAAGEADIRLAIGDSYLGEDQFAPAIAQFDLWIKNHPDDSKMPDALNARCWARALWDNELEKAEKDCSAGLKWRAKSSPEYAAILDSRGLVHLRQGNFAKALVDYDAALVAHPNIAWSLYGRGLCKLRLGKTSDGNTDVAAAIALRADIADRARKYGIVP